MFIVGITGGIGSGKSLVAGIFREGGAVLLDADEISRKITGEDGRTLSRVRDLLGPSFFDRQGHLDRKKVASSVFSDKGLLDVYSRIIHEEVLDEIAATLEKEREKGTKLVVLDVPIPVKKGFLDICNHVIVVSCADELRVTRLEQRGMDPTDAKRRIAMQMNREEYEELGDFVFDNSGSPEDLADLTHRYISDELGKRGIRL